MADKRGEMPIVTSLCLLQGTCDDKIDIDNRHSGVRLPGYSV